MRRCTQPQRLLKLKIMILLMKIQRRRKLHHYLSTTQKLNIPPSKKYFMKNIRILQLYQIRILQLIGVSIFEFMGKTSQNLKHSNNSHSTMFYKKSKSVDTKPRPFNAKRFRVPVAEMSSELQRRALAKLPHIHGRFLMLWTKKWSTKAKVPLLSSPLHENLLTKYTSMPKSGGK
eukprot:14939_4